MYKNLILLLTGLLFTHGIFATAHYNEDTIPVTYQLMDEAAFRNVIVGNTVVGITRQSHSIYMVHFEKNGICDMWKQNKIYRGSWWIEKDERGRDFVRARWPDYTSCESNSLFSPDNPRFGEATSLWYYVDTQLPSSIYTAGRKFRAQVMLAPGRAFPKSEANAK